GDRDACVLVAEEAQPGCGEPCGVADQRLEERHPLGHDATPIESDGGPELAPRRDEERHPSAEAEADDPDPGIVEPGLSEVRDGGVDVGDDPLIAHAAEEGHDLREVVVGSRPAPGPVEHRGGYRMIASGSEAACDVADVVVHTEG